jgi:hypothetical protein
MLKEVTKAYKILVKEPKVKRLLWQHRHGRKGKIKIFLILKVLDSSGPSVTGFCEQSDQYLSAINAGVS